MRESQAVEEKEEEVIERGIPVIPFDLFVSKGGGDLHFTDAFRNLVYSVSHQHSSNPQLCRHILKDASSNPIISLYSPHRGSWRCFRVDGNGEQLLFTVEQTVDSFNKVEFNGSFVSGIWTDLCFTMRGCLFWRSCTIYSPHSILAQTNLMYKLGFRKYFVRRSIFRLTLFPGFTDYDVIAALILVFMNGRK